MPRFAIRRIAADTILAQTCAAVIWTLAVFALAAPVPAQELPSIVPGVITIGRTRDPGTGWNFPEMLAVVMGRQIPPFIPAPETVEEWVALQSAMDEPMAALAREAARYNKVSFQRTEIAGVPSYVVKPETVDPRWGDRVFVHTHGGAWVFGGGDAALRESIWIASGLGVQVISVDYRKPPEDPFPAAVDDAVAVWLAVTKDQEASKTALFGTSAGGNITLATTLKLKDMGAPLPGAIFAGTPATDLVNISDTWHTIAGLDPLGARTPGGLIAGAFAQYIGDSDPAHPYLSPVNGDLRGYPPTILISGTRDLLLSDTVRMHRALRAAGVTSDLHVYDGQVHGDYMRNLLTPVPEAADAQREIYEFLDRNLD